MNMLGLYICFLFVLFCLFLSALQYFVKTGTRSSYYFKIHLSDLSVVDK